MVDGTWPKRTTKWQSQKERLNGCPGKRQLGIELSVIVLLFGSSRDWTKQC